MKESIRFFNDDAGATAVEYGMMIALITVAIIVTVSLIGEQINEVFESVLSEIAT